MRMPVWVFVLPAIWWVGGAEAADWTAVKLHGPVYADAGGGNWVRLWRGAVIADGRAVRTLGSGNAVFSRGAEIVAFGPNTQGEITDRPGTRPFTIVIEQAGTVAVSAEARAVQHFSVETPYLVAVVKGTQFTVGTKPGQSDVAVARGLVSVTGRVGRRTILLPAGERVVATAGGGMLVSGTVVPALVHPRIDGQIEDEPDGGAATAPGGIGDDVDEIGASLGGVVTDSGDTTGTVITGLGEATGDAVDHLGATLGGLGDPTGLAGATGSTLGTVGGAVNGLGTAAGSTVTSLTGTAGGAVTGLTGTVGGVVNGLTQSGGTSGGSAGGGLLQHLGL